MNRFTKKAIVKDKEEWENVRQHTRGGDGFPLEWRGSFPVLILETDNPAPKTERGSFSEQLYIFIERGDILELIDGQVCKRVSEDRPKELGLANTGECVGPE